MRHWLVALAAFVLPAICTEPALAHASVVSTSIAENARIAAAPETFTLEFSAPVGLASVTLINAEGVDVPLAFQSRRQMAVRHTLALPTLPAGGYTLSWRTIARDGHAMAGSLHFVVTGG